MTEVGALFTGDLSSLILIMLILVIISVVLSLISLILVRSSIKKAAPPPPRRVEEAAAPTTPRTVKPQTIPKKEAKKAVKPSIKERSKPALISEELGITSLEDLASMVGIKSILLFNEAGIPIESYNVGDEEKVAASAADFISLMRKLNPGFSSMTSENGNRVMLLSVEKVGEIEVFALAVSEAEAELGAEEIRDFLKAYLLESLGRYR